MINEYELLQEIHAAVEQFWAERLDAAERQRLRGNSDAGTRGQVTSGRAMDGFANIVKAIALQAGITEADVHVKKSGITLPGYFRPTKRWDVTVYYKGSLLAAIELKSHAGKSMSNNFNNRCEEALGSAVDFWHAHDDAFCKANLVHPFVGWLMLVESNTRSTHTHKKLANSLLQLDGSFKYTSYVDRYALFGERLIDTKLYTACCLLTTKANDSSVTGIDFPSDRLSPTSFFDALLTHLNRSVSTLDRL
jgi:type-2 restriction enzyme paeR7I